MAKILFCAGCGKKTAIIEEGSKLLKGMSVLCSSCESERVFAFSKIDTSQTEKYYKKYDMDLGVDKLLNIMGIYNK